MNFKVFAIVAVTVISGATVHQMVRGSVEAETKEVARIAVDQELATFINREYPARRKSEIKLLKLIEL